MFYNHSVYFLINLYMSKITFNKVEIITVAKVGSANFLNCHFYQTTNVKHGHSLLNLRNILYNKSNCLIIVGIRNPIDRNLSYLFQTYKDNKYNDVKIKNNSYKGEFCYIPNMAKNKFICAEKIIDLYFCQSYHFTFNEWFEEFLHITKINKFNKDKGIDFYNFPNNNTIMIYTLEKLSENEKYILDILGIKNLENKNDSNKRDYCKIYDEVKQKIMYKKEYLDKLLNTNIMRLFYNESDIKSFFSKYKTV